MQVLKQNEKLVLRILCVRYIGINVDKMQLKQQSMLSATNFALELLIYLLF